MCLLGVILTGGPEASSLPFTLILLAKTLEAGPDITLTI